MDNSDLLVAPYGQPTEEEVAAKMAELFSNKDILFAVLDLAIQHAAEEQEILNGLEEGDVEVTAALDASKMNYEQKALHVLAEVFGGKNKHPYYLHAMQDAYDMLMEGARKGAAIIKHAEKLHQERIKKGEIPPDTAPKRGRPSKQKVDPIKAELGVDTGKGSSKKSKAELKKEREDTDAGFREAAHEGSKLHRQQSERAWSRFGSKENANLDHSRLLRHKGNSVTR